MSFGNEFDIDKPVGSQEANTLDTIIEAKVKKALAERYALEHLALNSGDTGATNPASSNAQGRHKAGAVSVLLTGTTAEINTFANDLIAAGTPPGTGALALADGSELKYFDGTSFVTMGLTAEIYTAGDGLTLTDKVFAVDYADSDDIALGTSTTKIPAVADLKWAYGLTQYMLIKTHTNDSGVQVLSEDVWTTVFLKEAPVANSITGASLDTGSSTLTLPAGVYSIRAAVVLSSAAVSNNGGVAGIVRLYDDTAGDVVAQSTPTWNETASSGSQANTVSTSELYTELTLTEETELRLEAWREADNATQTLSVGHATDLDAAIVSEGIPITQIQIWKKKLG